VTRERIRQIEAKTLAKLTSDRESQRLHGFLD
jgi:DNA-directed RNA polymerase sigma subunit (sigma70/sigma32)